MSLSTQFITMLAMLLSGIYLGMVIDTFRRFERYWKKNIIMTYGLEILFWLLQGLVLFYFLFLSNQGEIRFYILLSVLCGYATYQALFRIIYKKILEVLIRWVAAFIRFCKRTFYILVYQPIKWVIVLITKILIGLWALIIWLLIILMKVIFFPIKLLGRIIWWMLPKNAKNFLATMAGNYSKIKNVLVKWWKYIQQKRG